MAFKSLSLVAPKKTTSHEELLASSLAKHRRKLQLETIYELFPFSFYGVTQARLLMTTLPFFVQQLTTVPYSIGQELEGSTTIFRRIRIGSSDGH
jgi:ABC-type molybdate transport system permease subunit